MPATGKYSPWRLWILVVFWVLQYLFLALELAIVIIAIVALSMSDVYYTAGAKAYVQLQLPPWYLLTQSQEYRHPARPRPPLPSPHHRRTYQAGAPHSHSPFLSHLQRPQIRNLDRSYSRWCSRKLQR